MIQIKNNEATSTDGKWVRNKITGAVAKRQGCLPSMSADDFEELDERPAYTEEQYAARVEALIAEKYSIAKELAVLRQKEAKPDEWEEYNAYAEACKAKAREELAKGVNNKEIKD